MKIGNTILKSSVCFLIIALVLASCSGNSSENSSDMPAEAPVEKQAEAPTDISSTPKSYTVEIKQMAFNPAEITVNKGDTIKFINNDILAHNATEEKSKLWASPNLDPGQSWTMVVNSSADYYCTIHPVMKGKIIMK